MRYTRDEFTAGRTVKKNLHHGLSVITAVGIGKIYSTKGKCVLRTCTKWEPGDLHQRAAYARQDHKKVLEPRVKACSRPLGTKKGLQQRGKPAHGRQGRKKKDLHEGQKPFHGREKV